MTSAITLLWRSTCPFSFGSVNPQESAQFLYKDAPVVLALIRRQHIRGPKFQHLVFKYLPRQISRVEPVDTRGTVTAFSVNKSVMIKMSFAFARVTKATGPRMSAKTVLNRIPTFKRTKPATLCLTPVIRAAHVRHHCTFFSTSDLNVGHQNRWRISANVFSAAKSPKLV